jgi:Cd2+/Zn2+-exporting ATPase/Cu+-exporting ATPase
LTGDGGANGIPAEIDDQPEGHASRSADLIRIGLVALSVLAGRLGASEPLFEFDVFSLLAAVGGGYPIFREAAVALWRRRMTMELSMSIAVLAAIAIGQYFTAAIIVLFVLGAEVLEDMTVSRGNRALSDLVPLLPDTALLRERAGTRKVPVSQLRAGDAIQIWPGSRIPVDGEVTSGHSFVDQAAITGESLPVEKVSGALVYAGTINQSGALVVRLTGLGRDTVFAGILETVERARRSRAPVQRLADRLAGYLVVFALASAALTLALTRNVTASIAVVIVAGACGVAAGTPLAILGALGRAARLGCIVRQGKTLEQLARIDTVVLDKTGTLTLGAPTVVGIHPVAGVTAETLLLSAAAAERPSEHPLAAAVLKKAHELSVSSPEPDRFEYQPGKGIRVTVGSDEILVGTAAFLREREIPLATAARIPSGMLVARGGRLLGDIEIADVLRPEATRAVAELHRLGITTLLFTGDSRDVATSVGSQLRVGSVLAELLPQDKLREVERLRAEGRTVAMIGDGINDAPALAGADVGVAMGSGTDLARESADVLLLGNDLERFAETVGVARSCRRIIFQNFGGTIAVDLAGIALAAAGFLTPLWAAAVHVSSELLFLLNSARLLRGAGSPRLRPARSG